MIALVDQITAQIESPSRRKFIRYTAASLVSVAITVSLQFIGFEVIGMSGLWSGFSASTAAAIPSYYMNRTWVWGKTGKSHMTKEVIPFWVMAVIGMVVSAWVSDRADHYGRVHVTSHLVHVLIVTGSPVATFGVLWILKYVLFNKILFAHREDELEPALDGRSGWPT